MKHSDIIIIGGGAAGMMAAYGAASELRRSSAGKDTQVPEVTVLEKMPRPGRKIMITGKGRCNITTTRGWQDFSSHIHPKPNPLKMAFYNFSTGDTVRFFNEHGLETVEERGERVFPASQEAADVVDTLYKAASEAGAIFETGCEVTDITVEAKDIAAEDTDTAAEDTGKDGAADMRRFRITCADGRKFSCRKLIITTGGLSYPGTGSTGDGYRWAESLGHTVSRCFPSLTAVVPEGYKAAGNISSKGGNDMMGLSTDGSDKRLKGHIDRSTPLSETGSALNGNQLKNIGLTLFIDGSPVQEEFGDIDFTDGGLEGPVGFKISRRCVNAILNGSRASISIDLKPAVSPDALSKRIDSLWKEIAADRRSQGKSYSDRFKVLLGKVLPQSLIKGFVRCSTRLDHRNLASALKNWKMDIKGYVGFERCVITAGGVSTAEIVAKTMESKVCPGLYFAGEILDLDGDTGGFNLQTAFSTGMLAGESAAKALL